jgi:hypothetical protein
MGRLRETDNGKSVDTTSMYPFLEGPRDFSGAPELMQIMAEGEQAHACYAKHLATFALQRELTEDDRSAIATLTTSSQNGGSMKDLISSLATSPAFTTRASGGTP